MINQPFDATLPIGAVLHSPERTYTIRKVLGKGGFGITYRASAQIMVGNIPVEMNFAIKEFFISDICSREHATSQIIYLQGKDRMVADARHDFELEATRLQKEGLSHDNIVKINEVFSANDTSYYVMEYLDGQTLDQYVAARGALSEAEALELLLPVTDAVAAMHSHRLTHLDIKPQNIMLTRRPDGSVRPVLIDFGLAKHYDKEGNATSRMRSFGYSAGYAPIEQYGGIAKYSPQSDVYSLAATLLFALRGTPTEPAHELVGTDIATLVPEAVSSPTRQSIATAMATTADSRPADASALAAMLRQQPLPAPAPRSITDDITHTIIIGGGDDGNDDNNDKSKRAIIWIAAALAGIAIMAGIWWIWPSSHTPTTYADSIAEELIADTIATSQTPAADSMPYKNMAMVKDKDQIPKPTADVPIKPSPTPNTNNPEQSKAPDSKEINREYTFKVLIYDPKTNAYVETDKATFKIEPLPALRPFHQGSNTSNQTGKTVCTYHLDFNDRGNTDHYIIIRIDSNYESKRIKLPASSADLGSIKLHSLPFNSSVKIVDEKGNIIPDVSSLNYISVTGDVSTTILNPHKDKIFPLKSVREGDVLIFSKPLYSTAKIVLTGKGPYTIQTKLDVVETPTSDNTLKQQPSDPNPTPASASAKGLQIRGKVVDDKGEELVGGTVGYTDPAGRQQYQMTDLDGNFNIVIKEGTMLKFTYVGYRTKTVSAKDGMTVVLKKKW